MRKELLKDSSLLVVENQGEPRLCTGCGNTYPYTYEYFHRNGNKLKTRCKQCRNEEERPRSKRRNDRKRSGIEPKKRGRRPSPYYVSEEEKKRRRNAWERAYYRRNKTRILAKTTLWSKNRRERMMAEMSDTITALKPEKRISKILKEVLDNS